jgi:broad-specificity NMP kinase
MDGGFLKKEIEKDKKLESEIKEILSRNQVAEYKVTIEKFSESLEPYYFWLVDFIKGFGYKMEKVDENIMASVTSAFFGEMAQRRMNFEKRGMEILGTINAIVRSIINLLYDLKELDRRLKVIEDLHI